MPAWQFQTAAGETNTLVGADNSNNAQATTNVASNADGSVLEREEYIQTTQDVPTADAATDTLMRDVVGRKTDAGIQAVTTTKSQMAYTKGILDILAGTAGIAAFPAAAAAGNAVSIAEVLRYIEDILVGTAGVVTFPAAALPANGVSLAEVLREIYDQEEKVAVKAAATMVNAQTLFTIAGGPIRIVELVSLCVSANDTTASTLQYSADPTDGGAITFSGATTTLASIAAGGAVILNGTALSTAPDISAVGVALGSVSTRPIVIPAGIITAVIGVGSTTGTWSHHLRYKPLARGVTVT